MKLLDTTFLIHHWAGRDAVADYLDTHDDTEFVTTTLNIKEIAVGRAIQGHLDPFEIRTTFEWVTIIPFQITHAITAGRLEAGLRQTEQLNQDKLNALTGMQGESPVL